MKVIRNYLYNLSYQILNIILPIITVPYVTRIFTSEELGNYGFYNSIVSYFALFAMLGISIYGTKQIAASRDVSSTFWNIYIIQVITSGIAIVIYFFIIKLIPGMSGMIPLILAISLFGKLVDISWLFSGKEDFKKITIRNGIVKLAGVISIFTFIKSQDQLYLYVFFLVVFDFLGQLVMWVPARKFLRKPAFNKEIIKTHIKPTVMLFLPQVAISLYVVLDRTLLGVLGSYSDVGIYEQGQKLTSILLTVVSSLGTVMLPRVSNLLSDNKHKEAENMVKFSFTLYNLIIFPMVFGLLAVNEIFIKLFLGESFQDVKYVIYIITINIMFIGWTNILGFQVLVVRDKNKEFMLSTTIPAVVSVLVNLAMIPWLGYIGASITSVIVEFLVFAIQWYYSRNIINKGLLFNKELLKIIIAAVGMFAVIEGAKMLSSLSGLLGLVVYVLVGGTIYLFILLLLKAINIREIKATLKAARNKYKDKQAVVRNCIAYINDRIAEKISLDNVSEYLGVNKSYLSSIFNKDMGISIVDYIHDKRVSNACYLLANTDFSISEVADYIGYFDTSYFIRIFKTIMKVTPLKYRESAAKLRH